MGWDLLGNIKGPAGDSGASTVDALTDATVVGKAVAKAASASAARSTLSAVGKGELVYNVLDYGAVGDGVADDTAPFQNCLNALSAAGGGTMLVPGGKTYALAVVQLRSNVHIKGEGAVLVKLASNGNYSMFIGMSGEIGPGYVVGGTPGTGYGAGGKNIKITGVTFRGSMPTAGDANGKGFCAFAIHHVSNLVVENCVFDQCQRQGHMFDMGGCEQIFIRNNQFIGFNTVGGTESNAECIQIDVSSWGAMSHRDVDGSYDFLFCRDVYVENNQFLPITVNSVAYPCPNALGSHTRVEGKYHENINFTGNLVLNPAQSVENTDSDGVGYQYGNIHIPQVHKLRIVNNTFKTTVSRAAKLINVTSQGYGATSASNPNTSATNGNFATPVLSEDIVIRDNVFDGFNRTTSGEIQPMIWVRGHTGGPVRRLTIDGNKFINGHRLSGSSDLDATCIWMKNVESVYVNGEFYSVHNALLVLNGKFVTISGCSIQDCTGLSVYLNSCIQSSVIGNTIADCGRPLSVQGSCEDAVISGNSLRDPKSSGANLNGMEVGGLSANCLITNNVVVASVATAAYAFNYGSSIGKCTLVGNQWSGFSSGLSPTKTNLTVGANYS